MLRDTKDLVVPMLEDSWFWEVPGNGGLLGLGKLQRMKGLGGPSGLEVGRLRSQGLSVQSFCLDYWKGFESESGMVATVGAAELNT